MKKLPIMFLCIVYFISFWSLGQAGKDFAFLNGFKYYELVPIYDAQYDGGIARIGDRNIKTKINNALENIGFSSLTEFNELPLDLKKNPCLSMNIEIEFYRGGSGSVPAYFSKFTFVDCNNNYVGSFEKRHQINYSGAFSKNLNSLRKFSYQFDSNLTPKSSAENILSKENISNKIGVDLTSEIEIRKYLENNDLEPLEGIWEVSSYGDGYKLFIYKEEYKYEVRIIEGRLGWVAGESKAIIEPAAVNNIVTVKWLMSNKRDVYKTVANVTNNAFIEFTVDNIPVTLYKVFPKLDSKSKTNPGEWAGNGSGIILSKDGYIATNYHVIEEASDLEVQFTYNNEIRKFNAKVVRSDPRLDLAIVKIDDPEFNNLSSIPYKFAFRSSDVATEIFALGYPLIGFMGEDVKFTDGRISAKSGFEGDITRYQHSAPIQPGNSGGPLFDTKGNLIGINVSLFAGDDVSGVFYAVKTTYLLQLIEALSQRISITENSNLGSKPLTEQIKILSDFVVLIRVR